jgi:hypothetical protein
MPTISLLRRTRRSLLASCRPSHLMFCGGHTTARATPAISPCGI